MSKMSMEFLVAYAKNQGFIYQGSELYGGLANTWDYGPLGVELKNNIKKAWWKKYIQQRISSYGIDAAILMNPTVWVASGHVGSFNDPLMDCKDCKSRHRADVLIENFSKGAIDADGWSNEKMFQYIMDNKIVCPKCGALNYTDIREFNLMFETQRGTTEANKSVIYLRPETAQGQYVNFLNVQRTLRAKVPFGIGQIGKVFRNEITPGNFTFRTIEFEQMEYQFFCKEGTDDDYYETFKEFARDYFLSIGIKAENLRYKDHEKLAHYAKAACDIQFLFPFGWGEVNGTHNRSDYDLKQHQEFSKKTINYLDPVTNEKYIPYVVESTIGADRAVLMVLCEAYDQEILENGDKRDVMRFNPSIAPYKLSVLPLIKKYHESKASEIYELLQKYFMTSYDESGNIGKRYRRQDAVGTPWCITIDDNTINDNTVTVRDRDTMEQVVIKVDEIIPYINDLLVK